MVWCYVFAATGLLLAALHYYLTCTYRYWKERSIPSVKGVVPGLGNVCSLLFMKKNVNQMYNDFYNEMTGCSMAGLYNMRQPTLIVRDPELVKAVLVKDFNSFVDNELKVEEKLDPLLALNPFFLNGARWKSARATLTLAFTTAKLKYMYVTVEHICAKLTKYLNQKLERNNGTVELELKDLFSRYTAEVVSDVAFGVEGESFESEKEGPFVAVGKDVFQPSLIKGLKQMIIFFLPFIGKLLKTRFLSVENDRFFRNLVKDVIRMREEQGVERNDFLQLMLQLRATKGVGKDEDTAFDVDSICSHAASFFVDGYETSSVTLSFVGYQLAANPDVQERLRQEVISSVAKHGGLTYEALQEMTYMDQVLNESSRTHPAVGTLLKKCTKEIVLVGSDGLTCRVKPGLSVVISVNGLHMDPEYWPNPEKFDPDRFSATSKLERHKFAFLPFSEGPRACIGMRMANMQMKAALATLLRNYSLELSPKTKLPIQMDPNYFVNTAKGGLWVYLKSV